MRIVSNASLNVGNKLPTLMSLLSGIYFPPLNKRDCNLCAGTKLTSEWITSNFQEQKFAITSHHISFISAGGKSRSAAELLLVVYHLEQSLRLRRIRFHSAQTNACSVPPAHFP
ncbi:hypothetical protein [Lapidilactobacillus bayanensis]|uniref:hypothetical protein n=1 Tax=Lapidilactobacillus bayanensis TaxID=2485998 RepID=UPI000F778839|nr:hypothetical protein [Lapidilactobacillus bayanensis]